MDKLKEKFKQKGFQLRDEIKSIRKEHADHVLGEHTIGQLYTGMKGIKGMPYETSSLDPNEGIRFRGYTIPELQEKLPKAPGDTEPLPEGVFYLMLMNELPTQEDVDMISKEWIKRGEVPAHAFKAIDALPLDTHPMTQFTIGINAMQTDSHFAKAYQDGVNRTDLWEHMFEDVMNLIARLPHIAAYIYRRTYKDGDHIKPDTSLDWSGNFAHMLGYGDNKEFMSLMRLYMTIHSDHEGGNVSAHTNRLVGTALSDAYLSFSAAMNGLAGPLHGLANQEVIRWIFAMHEELGTDNPSKEQIEKYVQDTLNSGRVVPGYGHAVLRKTDPRYTAQREFALKHMKDDNLINTVSLLYETVPDILKQTGKVKNPWPNVDAHSGALLVHYGFKEYAFYTVLFGVSRALGVLASSIWDRVTLLPLERPKSVTTEWIKEQIKK